MANPVGDASHQFMDKFSPDLIREFSSAYLAQVRRVADQILNGRVLIVDPSAGSLTSLPAFCVLEGGKVVDIGVIPVPAELLGKRWTIDKRLYSIGKSLRDRFPGKFDVLCVEYLHHTPMGNTVMPSFQHNTMSHGTIYASVQASHRVDISPWSWHQLRPYNYVKSDLVDVQLMAQCLLQDALSTKAAGGTP